MRYLKLYEAFKSEVLSKTLSFLSSDGKEKFLEKLQRICKSLDYPMSELSDDFFQSLNFGRALELFVDENHPKGQIKWIKFWFDRNGKYITTTCVDGNIKSREKVLDGYEFIKSLNLQEINQLQTGDEVYITLERDPVLATVYKCLDPFDGRVKVYMIQDENSGATPDERYDDWGRFGNYSWVITSNNDFSGTPKLLKKVTSEDKKIEIDPYSYNFDLDIYSSRIIAKQVMYLKAILNPANFALVLDVESLQEKDYREKSNIESERAKSRENSLALMTDDNIKTQNVKRYLSEIARKIKFDPDLANIKNLMIKMLGGKKLLISVLMNDFSDLNDLIHNLYSFIKIKAVEESEDKLKVMNNLFSLIEINVRSSFLNSGRRNTEMDTRISETKKLLNGQLNNKNKLILKAIDSYEKMLLDFYNEFNKKEINTLQEVEVIYYKMYAIFKLIASSRLEILRRFFYILIDSIEAKRLYDRLIKEEEKELEELNKLISEFSDTIIKILK